MIPYEQTVTGIMEAVKNEVCDKLCKYSDNWDFEQDGDLSESEHCQNCPLNRL